MPWIENCSYADILKAHHYDPGPNSLLISIVDPHGGEWTHQTKWPSPKYPFKYISKYAFEDSDDGTFAITKQEGKQIAERLKTAFANHTNVVVHCIAGICRSGAVVEAAISLGFTDTGKHRIPNLRVKSFILEHLSTLGGGTK
jgi:protein-tyrosine phosphatase